MKIWNKFAETRIIRLVKLYKTLFLRNFNKKKGVINIVKIDDNDEKKIKTGFV